MRRSTRLILIGLALLVLLFAVAVVAALALPAAPAAYDLSWQVLASGGTTMSSGNYTMLSTAGQPVAGPASSSGYSLLSGYWQSFQAVVQEFFLYFPNVRG